jgi:hypothetical protein
MVGGAGVPPQAPPPQPDPMQAQKLDHNQEKHDMEMAMKVQQLQTEAAKQAGAGVPA